MALWPFCLSFYRPVFIAAAATESMRSLHTLYTKHFFVGEHFSTIVAFSPQPPPAGTILQQPCQPASDTPLAVTPTNRCSYGMDGSNIDSFDCAYISHYIENVRIQCAYKQRFRKIIRTIYLITYSVFPTFFGFLPIIVTLIIAMMCTFFFCMDLYAFLCVQLLI